MQTHKLCHQRPLYPEPLHLLPQCTRTGQPPRAEPMRESLGNSATRLPRKRLATCSTTPATSPPLAWLAGLAGLTDVLATGCGCLSLWLAIAPLTPEALLACLQEFQLKMDNLQQRRGELERKEQQLQESLLKFDRFLKENDARRERAEKKAAEERQVRRTAFGNTSCFQPSCLFLLPNSVAPDTLPSPLLLSPPGPVRMVQTCE